MQEGITAFLVLLMLMLPVSTVWASTPTRGSGRGLLIAVSFPSLVDDVKPLLCSGDSVVSIAPRGVDPHSYQLTPGNVRLLEEADIIVSTAHTSFEEEIRSRVEEGGFKAVLIEIPRIPSIKLYLNPATGKPNYHMPIYDPGNYEVFLKHLVSVMGSLRPGCRDMYEEKLNMVLEKLRGIVLSAPHLNVTAVGDAPLTQYAVSWMGVNISYLVIREHGASASPEDIGRIRSAMSRGLIGLAVVTSPAEAAASRSLEDMAREYGVPLLSVPSPLAEGSIPEKLARIVENARAISRVEAYHRGGGEKRATIMLSEAGLAALVVTVALLSIAVVIRERLEFMGRSDWMLVSLSLLSLGLLGALVFLVEVRWVIIVASAALAYGFLSPVIAARRLYFLAGATPHAALLAAVLAIPMASALGLGEYAWAIIIGLALIYLIGLMIHRGIDPDTSTAVFVAFTASASVLAIYYVLTHYPRETDIMAIIVGDPLLAGWRDTLYAVIVAAASAIIFGLTYREQVCIGVERDSVRLTGIRVAVYDLAAFTMLAASTVMLIRIVGFVLEHVLILLPAVIASTAMAGAMRSLVASVNLSLLASLLGIWAAVRLDLAPSGVTGIILLVIYLAVLLYGGGRRRG